MNFWGSTTGAFLSAPLPVPTFNEADFSPDETCLITRSAERPVGVTPLKRGARFDLTDVHDTLVSLKLQGNFAVVTSRDKQLELWTAAPTWTKLAVLTTGETEALQLAVTPSGDSVAVAFRRSNSRRLLMWNSAERIVRELFPYELGFRSLDSFGLAFAPDGRYLAMCEGGVNDATTIHLWDVRAGRHVCDVRAEQLQRFPMAISFTPDHQKLIATTRTGVCWWSTEQIEKAIKDFTRPEALEVPPSE